MLRVPKVTKPKRKTKTAKTGEFTTLKEEEFRTSI